MSFIKNLANVLQIRLLFRLLHRVDRIERLIRRQHHDHPRHYHWPITFFYSHLNIKGDIMSFQLRIGQVLPFKLGHPVDNNGDEAKVQEGSLQLSSSDESVFTVEQDPETPDDPYSGLIVSQKEGTATFKAKADADLGEGVTEITLDVDGEILAADAVGFAPIQFGTPRPK